MDKEFVRQKNQMWTGVKIKYERDEVDVDDSDNDGTDGDIDTAELM
jgi:hypothetical protein